MPYTKDFIIVGGGLSGLYCAYQLNKKYPDKTITIFESDEELGGRIRSHQEKGFHVEKGAARFSETHKRLLQLLDELNLKDEMLPIPSKTSYIYRGKKCSYDLKEKIAEIVGQSKHIPPKELEKVTLYQLCVLLFGSDEANKIQALFGYDAELIRLNAYACLQMFQDDLLGDPQYYILKGGLTQMIEALRDSLGKKVEIKLGSQVTEVSERRVEVTIDKKSEKYSALHIICALPYLALRKLEYFKGIDEIHSVKPISLCRIYAKYPLKRGKPWFHDLQKTTTDNYLRYIIPMDASEGIIMYYSDLYVADMWRNWNNVSKDLLTQMIHRELRELYPDKEIPLPLKIETYHWKTGVHAWRPNFDYQEIANKMIKPTKDHIYVVGEAYSQHQDWMEGCLESSDRLLKLLS